MIENDAKPVFANGNFVGDVIGDIFHIKKNPSHIFHRYDSLNISKKALEEARNLGAMDIEMELSDGETELFYIPMELYEKSPLVYNNNGDIQQCMKITDLKLNHLQWL